MSLLEQRFLSEPGKTLISPNDKNAGKVNTVLKNAIQRGNFVLRCGMSTRYAFNFDAIY